MSRTRITRQKGAPFVLRGYTEQQREQLLRLIADGATKTVACEAMGIPRDTVSGWVRDDDVFGEKYKKARLEQVHSLGDQILEIADAPISTMEAVQHAKLRVEARKWLMSKWAPRHYGEKMQTDHTHTVGVVLLPALDTNQKAISHAGIKDVLARMPGSDGVSD